MTVRADGHRAMVDAGGACPHVGTVHPVKGLCVFLPKNTHFFPVASVVHGLENVFLLKCLSSAGLSALELLIVFGFQYVHSNCSFLFG